MGKISAVQKWFIIRDSLLELQNNITTDPVTKRQVKKSVKRKKRRIK